MRGLVAARAMHEEVRPNLDLDQFSADEKAIFQNSFKPRAEYHHVSSCFHGSAPQAIIQGSEGIARSIYFKRCNGEMINAVGEVLKATKDDETDDQDWEDDDGINEDQNENEDADVDDEDKENEKGGVERAEYQGEEQESGSVLECHGVNTDKMMDLERQTATERYFTVEGLAEVMWQYNRERDEEDFWSDTDSSEEGSDDEE